MFDHDRLLAFRLAIQATRAKRPANFEYEPRFEYEHEEEYEIETRRRRS